MAKKKKKSTVEKYDVKEIQAISQEIERSMKDLPKFVVDDIINYIKERTDRGRVVRKINLTDTVAIKTYKAFEAFQEIKEAAKFSALEKLVEMIEFEKEIAEKLEGKVEEYLESGIGSRRQLAFYNSKKRNKQKQESSNTAETESPNSSDK